MEIEEAVLMKILVNGNGHIMANAHHGAKRIGTKTHVSVLAHVFKTLTLLLHGIVTPTQTVNLKAFALNLRSLSCTLTLY